MSQGNISQEFRDKIQLAKEEHLEKLDLSYEVSDRDSQKLTSIPNEVFELTQLKELNLSNNNIQDIPSQISRLTNLEYLDLIGNEKLINSSSLEQVVRLHNLLSLGLTWEVHRDIPKWFNQIKQLKLALIDLTESGTEKSIKKIPNAIVNLKNLVFLNIWIKFSEDLIGRLSKLEKLELLLNENQLTILPESITKLSNLTRLNLNKNQLTTLPESIINSLNLTRLDLNDNQLTTLPESITKLSNLARLHLSNNQLTTLPESLGNLSKLTWLDLNDNQLTTLPESITKLSELTWLDLSNNQLSTLPESITKLSELTWLDLKNNQLSILPESLGNLSNITRLDLKNNQLSTLPESITNLLKLTWLDLKNNRLRTLPESITNLSKSTWLDLSGNPLEKPPIEVAQKGIEEIRNYFRQLKEQGIDYIYEAKLLIIGEAGAGKTTLAKKITDPNYQLNQDEKSTEGIDVTKWSFTDKNKREFKVNIWDFGGQEIYHATHRFFLTKRSVYCLVLDNRKEDDNLYYWLNIVELLSDNSPLLIIKNEKQNRTRDINERILKGQFENIKETLTTNLATDRQLDKIFSSIEYFIGNLDHIGSELPATWVKVRRKIEQDKRHYITLNEYLNICQVNGMTRKEDKLQLSGYLHDLGVCLHFQDDKKSILYKTVILKPEWATTAVYRVLDNTKIKEQCGCFNTDDLSDIWQEEQYDDMRGELLQLMMKFELCYQIPNIKETFIAPQLLTNNQPEYDWDESHNLILRYTYPDFMPKGILSRFIVVMHPYIDRQESVWKSGVILDQDNTKAEVIEYYGKREIRVRVTGIKKRDFMTIVMHELDKINNSYNKRLKYRLLIPCNCFECKNQQEPYFHPFAVLQKAKEKRQREVQCQKSFQMVNVFGLIDDVIIGDTSASSPEADIHSNTIINNYYENTNFTGDHSINIHPDKHNKYSQNRKRNASDDMTTKILVLASNPRGTDQLLLNQEIRDIEAALRNSSQDHLFSLKPQLAVRIQDLQSTILREKPRLVHFCGHGTGSPGLLVETSSGTPQLVNTPALANLFKLFSHQVECVILNACYSESQAQAIHQHINYVIGTTHAIKDPVAILFSQGFYGALGEGKSIEEAFHLGLNRIELEMNIDRYPERKLVPVKLELEHQYQDRSGNLVLTLLKNEPLNRITNDEIEAEIMSDKSNITINQGDYNDSSHTQNISGRNINASGAGAFSLGDNSGTIANTINQLPSFDNEPHKKELKDLLRQLQTAVNKTDLDNEDKEETLEQINAIAFSLQNSQDSAMKKAAKRAMKMLRGTAAALPPTASMVTLCNQLPELIGKIF